MRATPLPPDERRKAIIEAARPLLIASGAKFTTKQVAEAAGIAEGTIFRVFDSKDNLLAAVIEDALDPTELCTRIRALPAQDSLEDHLGRLIELLQRDTDAISAVASALHHSPNCLPPKSHRDHAHGGRQHRSTAVRLALAESLTPWADAIRVPLPQAASLVRSMALASAHPMITDRELTDPAVLAGLLVHGIHKD